MKTKFEKYIGTEAQFQCAIADYLRHKGVLFTHPPNGGNRNIREAAHLKKQGVSKGVPDILIFEPRGEKIGLALELKVKHNKPSKNQHEWLVALSLRGWECHWSNSLDEVIGIINYYLKQSININ